jgi:hypothetical protein
MRNPNKMFYRLGQENKEFWALKEKLRPTMKHIPEKSNGWYDTYEAELNGSKYEVVDDIENGISYSIEKLN